MKVETFREGNRVVYYFTGENKVEVIYAADFTFEQLGAILGDWDFTGV
ncbi:MAG TPA: hypothetical protein IGS17_00605 [Oscillatoriales cyanobacterium M59_W2019_021]|nr:hypothetical protein [Oscillatoriales cyanobacterium M4454_W2019_049]HIK49417.1 hypothetical protein [Oscillatoriales cyanobacterium M59_W2019_021]